MNIQVFGAEVLAQVADLKEAHKYDAWVEQQDTIDKLMEDGKYENH